MMNDEPTLTMSFLGEVLPGALDKVGSTALVAVSGSVTNRAKGSVTK